MTIDQTKPRTDIHTALLVLPLYVAFGCSAGLLQVAVPTVLQTQGMSIERAGMLALLYLPFGLSALWAPLVDRFYLPRWGRRKSWVVPCQTMVVLALLVAAFVGPGQVAVLVTAMAALSVSAATMDVALDGYMVETSNSGERAWRGGIKVGGMLLGTLIGSLMVLAMLERAGWSLTMSAVAALAACAAVPFLFHGERSEGGEVRAFPSIARFLRTPGMARRVGFVVLLGLALGIGLGAPRLLMVAQGFPLSSIGAIFGPVGAIAGVVGAVAGTTLGSRYGLPLTLRLAAFLFFAAVAAMAAGFAEEVRDIGMFGSVIAAGVVAYAAIFGGICALAMGWVGREQAATDYSTVLSAWNLSLVLGTALAGLGVSTLGLLAFPAAGLLASAAVWRLTRTQGAPAGGVMRSADA